MRKAHYGQTDAKIIEARTMRNFNSDNFLNDLNQQPWAEVCHNAADPNKMWQIWKPLLLQTTDKHAPIRIKRVGKKNSPWITGKLRHLLFERFSKKESCKIWRR